LTSNKSQGQTFKKIALYLPTPVFAYGQLYVALFRVENPNNITIMVTYSPIDGQLLFASTPKTNTHTSITTSTFTSTDVSPLLTCSTLSVTTSLTTGTSFEHMPAEMRDFQLVM